MKLTTFHDLITRRQIYQIELLDSEIADLPIELFRPPEGVGLLPLLDQLFLIAEFLNQQQEGRKMSEMFNETEDEDLVEEIDDEEAQTSPDFDEEETEEPDQSDDDFEVDEVEDEEVEEVEAEPNNSDDETEAEISEADEEKEKDTTPGVESSTDDDDHFEEVD